jgi:D-lactate dehydrogenase (cytochrome)
MYSHRIHSIIIYRPIVGHVGDGNFHVILIFDTKNLEEVKRVREFGTVLAKYGVVELIFIISLHC